MAIHPPLLYLGYVGFLVPFACAVSALAERERGPRWVLRTQAWAAVIVVVVALILFVVAADADGQTSGAVSYVAAPAEPAGVAVSPRARGRCLQAGARSGTRTEGRLRSCLVRRIICSVFRRTCAPALRVASCETGGTFNPRARGSAGERGHQPVVDGDPIRV